MPRALTKAVPQFVREVPSEVPTTKRPASGESDKPVEPVCTVEGKAVEPDDFFGAAHEFGGTFTALDQGFSVATVVFPAKDQLLGDGVTEELGARILEDG